MQNKDFRGTGKSVIPGKVVQIKPEYLKSFSEKNNINFINFFPFFFSKENSFDENLKIIKKYYIPFDVHFNKKGNELIANNFLNFYEIQKENNN